MTERHTKRAWTQRRRSRRAWRLSAIVTGAAVSLAFAVTGQSPTSAPTPTQPGMVPATSPATAPAIAPATRPVDPAKYAVDRQRLADYLMQEYGKLAQSPDFVSRSIAAMLAARLPDLRATEFLLKLVETDKHPATQMLAWEGLLSRADWVSADQHKRWILATKVMAKKDYFRGALRAGLMELLATAPADPASLAIATDVFAHTDSRRVEDDATLEALGRAIAIWKNRTLTDQLMSRLGTSGGSGKRAVRVLSAAGFPLSPPPEPVLVTPPGFPPGMIAGQPREQPLSMTEMRNAVDVWKKQRLTWKSDGQPADRAWLKLSSRILPNLPGNADINPYDNRWYKELELGRPDLSHFDVAFVIDVSSSMGPAVSWVKREIAGMMTVLGLVAREPRIGLTFFGCRNDRVGVQPTPLTSDIRKLTGLLNKVTFATGGEELVFDGLRECVRTSKWSQGNRVAKVLILVGDEQIDPKQVADCNALAQAAAEKGFRVFAICPRVVPPTYAEVCRLGNGQAFALQLQPTRLPPQPIFPNPIAPPATQPATQPATTQPATTPAATDPGATQPTTLPAEPAATTQAGNPAEVIVTGILTAAIRPEYRDRVQPMVKVITAMNSPKETEPEPKR